VSELALLEPRLGAPGADGGGQLALGRAATILAGITLRALRSLDVRIPREQRAIIVVSTSDKSTLADRGGETRKRKEGERIMLAFEVRWRQVETDGLPLSVLGL